jgi:NADPH2:quinone reductase
MKAVQIIRTGGPEVLDLVELALPEPGPGEVRVRHAAIGLNFIDTYHRSGLYPLALPAVIGREMAGTVEALGSGVTAFKVGDRVASSSANGAYAEASVQAANRLVRLPATIGFDVAAASLLKGMTAEFLARRLWPVAKGDTVLVHAAAGGVGSLLCQWLSHLGVRVIGTVGSPQKQALAEANGCSDVILYRQEDVAAKVRTLTSGDGVRVAFDSVGKDTLEGSLGALAKRGLFVSFGNASGPAPPVDPLRLSQGGSLFMTRPTLYDYIDTPEALQASADALFEVMTSGVVKISIDQRFALADVRQAHVALQNRDTTGATVLTP